MVSWSAVHVTDRLSLFCIYVLSRHRPFKQHDNCSTDLLNPYPDGFCRSLPAFSFLDTCLVPFLDEPPEVNPDIVPCQTLAENLSAVCTSPSHGLFRLCADRLKLALPKWSNLNPLGSPILCGPRCASCLSAPGAHSGSTANGHLHQRKICNN